MTGYKGRFTIKWWAWYLVDTKDWYHPVIVRKHFTYKNEAIEYKDRWLSRNFHPIKGDEAIELSLRDGVNYKKKNRHSTRNFSKYKFPRNCITQKQRKLYRLRQQRKIKKLKRMREITVKELYYLLEKKPITFAIRCHAYRNWHFSYSSGSPNLKRYIKEYQWPVYVNTLVIIEKVLLRYNYDLGPFPVWYLALEIYREYGKLITKMVSKGWVKGTSPKTLEKVAKEFKARGFVETSLPQGSKRGTLFISSIHTKKTYYWPEKGKFGTTEGCGIHIYQLHEYVGIPGFTSANVPGS